jgi:D-alanyl-D-alanine dipeptidase
MPQISTTLPKEAWQPITIIENNDPIVRILPTPKLHLATPHIHIRSALIQMLEQASNHLPDEFCLYIVEGVRTLEKQQALWNECHEQIKKEFPHESIDFWNAHTGLLVAPPSPLANHNCGGAVDVTLIYKDSGEQVDMGTSIQSGSAYSRTKMFSEEIQDHHKHHRTILRESMERAGFVWYPGEWWHYCYGDRMWAVYSGKKECVYGPISIQ